MNQLVFFAGDTDFRPLVDAVVRDGMYVTLRYFEGSTSRDLINMADHAIPVDIFALHALLSDRVRQHYVLPQVSLNFGDGLSNQPGAIIGYGKTGTAAVAQVWKATHTSEVRIQSLARTNSNHYYLVSHADDLAMTKRVFEVHCGKLEWEML